MIYFAYGSNMSHERLLNRVPSSVPLGTGFLYGHTMAFHKIGRLDGSGKCDASHTGDQADCLPGALYHIDPGHKSVLDSAEGLGKGYEIKHVSIQTLSGMTLPAFIYYATHIDGDLKPFHWYKYHVIHGARQNNLPSDHIDNLLSVVSVRDPDDERTELEMEIYRNHEQKIDF